jgi:GNAT superfamily N-acetyltransferase
MTPEVRVAQADDAPDVVRLLLEFRAWYGKPETPEARAQFERVVGQLIGREDSEYLLAGPEGAPVAVAQVRYRPSIWTGSEDCWIEDVYVADAARGQGLGRALVVAALDRARARGCGRAELDVDVVNGPARALYGSLGFRDKTEGGSLLLQVALD